MLVGMSLLASCVAKNFDSRCLVFPPAGEKVAKEMEKASFEEYPNTWEWLGRLYKLKQEIEVCKI